VDRVLVIAGFVALVWTVGVARQGAPQPPPRPLVPAATNSIAGNPESFYGKNVTVTAAVERILSATSFTVDQDAKKAGAGEVLVLVDVLNAPLTPNTYVTVIGEVVRHEGAPAIRAASVINASMIDIAKRLPPPMTADEEVLDKAMKRIGPAFNAMRQAVAAGGSGTAKDDAAALKAAFADADGFWKKQGKPDAQKWSSDARAQADVLAAAVDGGKWDEAKTALGPLQQTCSACHGAYRQRLDDGSYRLRTEK
jgi:cytochrome c556